MRTIPALAPFAEAVRRNRCLAETIPARVDVNILSISHTYPFPPDDGSRVRIWNTVSNLARYDRVLLLTSGRADAPEPPELTGLKVEVYPAPAPDTALLGRVRRLLRCVLDGVPASVVAGRSRALLDRADEVIRSGWPDVLVVEGNSAALELLALADRIPSVLVKHSVHAIDAEEAKRRRGRLHPRWALEEWITRRFEGATLARADAIVVPTPEDAADLEGRYGPQSAWAVPNGVDRDRFPWRPDPGTRAVAFVGNFGWGANVDAALWLVREVWPQVMRFVPDARLKIVGKGLSPELHEVLGGAGLQVQGYVPDVADVLQDVAVGLVPVRMGTGIRCKVLEFFSLGIAVVSTPLGVRGLPAQAGVHCLLAEDSKSFADSIYRLLVNPTLRRSLAQAALRLVEDMTWDRQAAKLHRLLASLIGPEGLARSLRGKGNGKG